MFKKDPEGYKKLLVYKKSEELMEVCFAVTREIKAVKGEMGIIGQKTLLSLADQMDRSMRSVKQNIVEGWKRNTTKEYFDFLGFSMGSLTELIEDIDDIIKGRYEQIRGLKGVMGEKGLQLAIDKIEKLPFHPLDPLLPLIVKFKLRAKELSYLIYRLQQSLEQKMKIDGSLPARQKINQRAQQQKEADDWLNQFLK